MLTDRHWEPSCSLELLQLRAKLLQDIRHFFTSESVLEVETPSLCHFTVTDPYVDSFKFSLDVHAEQDMFLQTSPEFAMKRLLAAGTGSIYQICKAFRLSESGRLHNPEFSILEWYRVDFDLQALMADVEAFFQAIFPDVIDEKNVVRLDYVSLFKSYTGLDALVFDINAYRQCALEHDLNDADTLCANNHAAWLDFLFSEMIQPHLGVNGLCIVYDYPIFLPSLARINKTNNKTVARIEVFIQGIEIGNGFFELSDVAEQTRRFDADIGFRQTHTLANRKKDIYLLAALAEGLPMCSGIALGIDRILMLMSAKSHINDVLAFPVNRA